MKKLLVFLFVLSITKISFAQSKYIPFIDKDKYWIYSQQDDWEPAPNTFGGFVFSFGSDTIINGIKYSKLIKYGLAGESPCSNRPCFFPYIPYQIDTGFRNSFAYLREDTISRKVYCLPAIELDKFCDSKEHVLFDFGQKVGDTLITCNLLIHSGWPISDRHFKIDSIKTEFIYNKVRQVSYFEGFIYGGLPFIVTLRMIEGIGIDYNLGFYIDPTARFEGFCEGTLEQCNIISSTKNAHDNQLNKLVVYPNPATNFIKVESSIDVLSIEIIDQNGKVLLNSSAKEINIAHLRSGLHIVRCLTKKNELFYTKFVKI